MRIRRVRSGGRFPVRKRRESSGAVVREGRHGSDVCSWRRLIRALAIRWETGNGRRARDVRSYISEALCVGHETWLRRLAAIEESGGRCRGRGGSDGSRGTESVRGCRGREERGRRRPWNHEGSWTCRPTQGVAIRSDWRSRSIRCCRACRRRRRGHPLHDGRSVCAVVGGRAPWTNDGGRSRNPARCRGSLSNGRRSVGERRRYRSSSTIGPRHGRVHRQAGRCPQSHGRVPSVPGRQWRTSSS